MANVAMRAAERSTHSVAVYDLCYVKPLDKAMVLDIGKRFSKIVTIEDGVLRGGVGETISAMLASEGLHPTIKHLGIDDKFVEQGTPAQLYSECGYDEESLLATLENL
jgi:1-deoxy-D-xylulose-5-phosphate synthase